MCAPWAATFCGRLTGEQLDLPKLGVQERWTRPSIVLVLGQQMPCKDGDFASRGDRRDLLATSAPDANGEGPQRPRSASLFADLSMMGCGRCATHAEHLDRLVRHPDLRYRKPLACSFARTVASILSVLILACAIACTCSGSAITTCRTNASCFIPLTTETACAIQRLAQRRCAARASLLACAERCHSLSDEAGEHVRYASEHDLHSDAHEQKRRKPCNHSRALTTDPANEGTGT